MNKEVLYGEICLQDAECPEYNKQRESLEQYISRREQYLREAEELRQEPSLKLQDILDNQYAVAQMDSMIKQQMTVVEQFEAKLERVRIKLTRNVQERKMQEILRDRAYAEYLEEEKQEEAKENDQRSSFTYGQKQKE